jgi:D-xylose 1-dehydrogenase (NADP+, D-xylono-1,5-lactone-forming)
MATWGILGVAGIAVRELIPAIQSADGESLLAIASRDPGRASEAARRFGIPRAYGSYGAMLEDPDVETVYIPLPNSLHHEWTIRCAEAGKHVLCDKPLAVTVGQCAEMVAACRQHGVKLMEGFMYRFHPRIQRLGELLASNAIGDVRIVRVAHTGMTRGTRETDFRYRPELGGGATYDNGCYAANLARLILGEPKRVFASGYIGASGVDEQIAAILHFGAGRDALIDCSITLPRRQECEIVGTHGRIVIPKVIGSPVTEDAVIHISRGDSLSMQVLPAVNQYRLMVEHFGAAVSHGTVVDLPPDDAIKNLAVVEAVLRSLRSGQPEPVAGQ